MPMIFLSAAAIAVLTFFLVLLLVAYARYIRRRDLFSRMEKYNVIPKQIGLSESGYTLMEDRVRRLLTRAAAPFAGYGSMQAWDIKMRKAGIPLLGGEFLVAVISSALLAGIGVWMLMLDILMAVLAGAVMLVLFWLLITLRVSQRRSAFTEQLGDALTTIANALRAGYSFQQAMEVISKEMEPPISEEFFQAMKETSMGVPLETALENLNQRVESSDFELVVTAVIIQREVGGNLAQILDTISDTIGERIRMKREIFALTSQGRFSALILFLLPFAIGFFMYCVNPGQIMMLFEDPIGRMALGISFLLELVGIVVINRIVNIKI